MTISDAQAETWSCATAELLSGITDDPDMHCESFSRAAACGPAPWYLTSSADDPAPYHAARSGCAQWQIQAAVAFAALTGRFTDRPGQINVVSKSCRARHAKEDTEALLQSEPMSQTNSEPSR